MSDSSSDHRRRPAVVPTPTPTAFSYHASVEALSEPQPVEETLSALLAAAASPGSSDVDEADGEFLEGDSDASTSLVGVAWGHPRIETIEGVIHVYRPADADDAFESSEVLDSLVGRAGAAGANEGGASASDQNAPRESAEDAKDDDQSALAIASEISRTAELRSSKTVCVLAVPSHMSVADFLAFVGAFIRSVRHMRVVRHRSAVSMQFLSSRSGDEAATAAVLEREDDDGSAGVSATSHIVFGEPSTLRYNVLIEFDRRRSAEEFVKAYDGQAFSPLGPETCRILYIRSVEILRRSHDPDAAATDDEALPLFPPSGATELPSCPVCLERLDENSGGLLTIVCNHSFHCKCLAKWRGDNTCPVCRYSSLLLDADDPATVRCSVDPDKAGASVARTSGDFKDSGGGSLIGRGPIRCEIEGCDSTESLWMCLICGHVGCGRYTNQHARQHYEQTMHVFSLDMETKRVWDYAGDHYAHRLIAKSLMGASASEDMAQSAEGGELSDAQVTPPRLGRAAVGAVTPVELQPSMQLSPLRIPELEIEAASRTASSGDAVTGSGAIAEKLTAISAEYAYLLEAQRRQYETLLLEAERTRAYKLQCLEEDFAFVLEQKTRAERMAAEAAARAKREALRASKTGSQHEDLRKEVEFLAEVNANLRQNDDDWRQREAEARKAAERMAEEQRVRVTELEDQVKDLMFYIESQQKLQAEGVVDGGDLIVKQDPNAPVASAAADFTDGAGAGSAQQSGGAGRRTPSKRGKKPRKRR